MNLDLELKPGVIYKVVGMNKQWEFILIESVTKDIATATNLQTRELSDWDRFVHQEWFIEIGHRDQFPERVVINKPKGKVCLKNYLLKHCLTKY